MVECPGMWWDLEGEGELNFHLSDVKCVKVFESRVTNLLFSDIGKNSKENQVRELKMIASKERKMEWGSWGTW